MGGEDFKRYLPQDIFDDILTRLPVVTIMRCKCVCKSWLDLLTTREFANSYLSKSVPGLLILELEQKTMHPKAFKFIEFSDDDRHHLKLNTTFNFDLPFNEALRSSVNGLLLLWKEALQSSVNGLLLLRKLDGDLLLCNPITREYIKLPCSLGMPSSSLPMIHRLQAYGFGVSRMSRQYKVVRIFNEEGNNINIYQLFECEVYIVGTGSWRRISTTRVPNPNFVVYGGVGVFFNGNLHWLLRREQILCLDLETELFSTFSYPLADDDDDADDDDRPRNLSVLGDCLCICYHSRRWKHEYASDIWLMKVYGNEKSWAKEFSIPQAMEPSLDYLYPVKVFKDGHILMILGSDKLMLYHTRTSTETTRQVDLSGLDIDTNIFCSRTLYVPSFLPLKTFTMENVTSF